MRFSGPARRYGQFTLTLPRGDLIQFLTAHAGTVVNYRAAVNTFLFDRLPFNSKFDSCCLRFEGVLEKLTSPLVGTTRLEHAVDKIRGTRNADLHAFLH